MTDEVGEEEVAEENVRQPSDLPTPQPGSGAQSRWKQKEATARAERTARENSISGV